MTVAARFTKVTCVPCEWCKKTFRREQSATKFCSHYCRQFHNKVRRLSPEAKAAVVKEARGVPTRSAIVQILREWRRREGLAICKGCGGDFKPSHDKHIYCNPVCEKNEPRKLIRVYTFYTPGDKLLKSYIDVYLTKLSDWRYCISYSVPAKDGDEAKKAAKLLRLDHEIKKV